MSKRREPAGTVSRRRSWSILIAWGVAIAVLAFLGSRPDRPACADVAGGAGHALLAGRSDAARKFGNTIPIAILLRGPPAQVDRQGRRLVAALRGDPRRSRCSRPGIESSTMRSLRPNPGAAFVLVNYIRPASRAMAVVPSTEAI